MAGVRVGAWMRDEMCSLKSQGKARAAGPG